MLPSGKAPPQTTRYRLGATFAVAAFALIAAVPSAAQAQDAGFYCVPQTDHEAEFVETPGETLYVRTFSGMSNGLPAIYVQLWRESNDILGLQTSGTWCSDGSTVPADWMQLELALPDPTRVGLIAV